MAKKKKVTPKKSSSRISDLAVKITHGYQATIDEIKELASTLVGKGKKKKKAKATPEKKAAKKTAKTTKKKKKSKA